MGDPLLPYVALLAIGVNNEDLPALIWRACPPQAWFTRQQFGGLGCLNKSQTDT